LLRCAQKAQFTYRTITRAISNHTLVCQNPTNWKIEVRWLHASCCSHDSTECRPPHLYKELAVMVQSGYCSSDHALCVYVVDCRIWCTANILCVLLHRKKRANPYTETCCMRTLLTCSYIFDVIYETIQWVPSSIPKLVKTEGEALWDSAATFCLDTIMEVSDSNHFSCQAFTHLWCGSAQMGLDWKCRVKPTGPGFMGFMGIRTLAPRGKPEHGPDSCRSRGKGGRGSSFCLLLKI